ncbi:MAG: type III-B CRISPR module RAMP protein Cmr4 [Promethearchaeota archaeon]
MNEDKKPEVKKYHALALDPIHVGTGGMRLGRVDLPIMREPSTNLPKIPGTTISGCARYASSIVYGKTNKLSCAGSGGKGGENHCGKVNPACEICIPFGFSKGSGGSMQGLAQFFDAHITLFPVASMMGPIWVSTGSILNHLGVKSPDLSKIEGYYPLGDLVKDKEKLNLGWLLLEKCKPQGQETGELSDLKGWLPNIICDRIVLLSDTLFSHVVNSNLEVRTSISIEPDTGAAEDGALFTYEAIPRSTVLSHDIVYNDGTSFKINGQDLKTESGNSVTRAWVKEKVENGLRLFETLGVGGMNTRGMGRMKVLNLDENKEGIQSQ